MGDKLNDKQKQFCREYVYDFNKTQAAIRAGYSEKTAKEQGYRLFTNVHIQEYIAELQKDIARLAGVSKLSVVNRLMKIADTEDDEDTTPANKIKALEVVNKMLGFNDPEKKDITSGGKSISPIDWAE